MNQNNSILAELVEISPQLAASINQQLPYGVPLGYFDTLSANIICSLSIETKTIIAADKAMPFEVPEAYFDFLPINILNKIKINQLEKNTATEELKGIAPTLASLKNELPFSKPEEYFEELSENAIAGISAIDFVNEKLENTSPLLASLQQINVYAVDKDYFSTFAEIALEKATKNKTQKLRVSFQRKLLNFSIAAILISFVATSAWMFFNHTKVVNSGAVANNNVTIPDSFKVLTDEELLGFTESSLTLPEDISGGDNVENVADLLSDIPDETLEEYLNEEKGNIKNFN